MFRKSARRLCQRQDSNSDRGNLRRLMIEPLENRSLLAVSLNLTVCATNLPCSARVPIINAEVLVTYWDAQLATIGVGSGTTNTSGNCVVSLPDLNPGGTFDVHVAAEGSLDGVNYAVDIGQVSANDKEIVTSGPTYAFSANNIQATNASFSYTVAINAAATGNYLTANALAIYSILSMPLGFAYSLGATLPSQFVANYPNGSDYSSWYLDPSEFPNISIPTIAYCKDVLTDPDPGPARTNPLFL